MQSAAVISEGRRRTEKRSGLTFRLVRMGEGLEPALTLAEAAHRESRFGYIPFDREKTRRVVEQALAQDRRHLISVVEVGGRVEGFVFASTGEYIFGSGALIVTINTIYTSQELRGSLLGGKAAVGLFGAVRRWAAGIGAVEVLLHATSGIEGERVGRVVRRLGFQAVGGSFAARVM